MTIARIVLLTQAAEGEVLADILRACNPSLRVLVVSDNEAVARLAREDLTGARLLSFCSPVIVPGEVLAALPGPAYNFHPGPPDRPGRYPSVFAIYEKAQRFGVTVHEMTRRVDAGPIVTAEWFPIPENADILALESLALERLAMTFRRLAAFLALNPLPLPRMFIPWSGKRRTKADCEAVCRIAPGMSEAEVELLKRACGPLLKN